MHLQYSAAILPQPLLLPASYPYARDDVHTAAYTRANRWSHLHPHTLAQVRTTTSARLSLTPLSRSFSPPLKDGSSHVPVPIMTQM